MSYKQTMKGSSSMSQRDSYGKAMSKAFKGTKNFGLISKSTSSLKGRTMSAKQKAARRQTMLSNAASKMLFRSKR